MDFSMALQANPAEAPVDSDIAHPPIPRSRNELTINWPEHASATQRHDWDGICEPSLNWRGRWRCSVWPISQNPFSNQMRKGPQEHLQGARVARRPAHIARPPYRVKTRARHRDALLMDSVQTWPSPAFLPWHTLKANGASAVCHGYAPLT